MLESERGARVKIIAVGRRECCGIHRRCIGALSFQIEPRAPCISLICRMIFSEKSETFRDHALAISAPHMGSTARLPVPLLDEAYAPAAGGTLSVAEKLFTNRRRSRAGFVLRKHKPPEPLLEGADP